MQRKRANFPLLSSCDSSFDSDPISKLNLTIDLWNRKTELIDLIEIKRFIKQMISWMAMIFDEHCRNWIGVQ
jgi:hypothetical protein